MPLPQASTRPANRPPANRPPPLGGGVRPPQLSPWDVASFAIGRQNATFAHQTNKARLNYLRGQAGEDYSRGFSNLTRQFRNQRDRFAGQYAGRGLLNSGIYGRGLQDFYTNRDNAFGDLTFGHQRQLNDYTFQQQQSLLQRQNTMQAINAQQQARRAQIASSLTQGGS